MDRKALLKAMRDAAAEKPKPVTVNGYGTVYVRALTVAEVEAEQELSEEAQKKHRFPRAVAKILCDEEGKRLFSPDSAEDMELLAAQPWSLLQSIMEAARGEDKAVDVQAGK